MMSILEDVFHSMLLKKFGEESRFDIIVNIDKGDLEIWHYREIVEDGEVLGSIAEIQRLADVNYMFINTDKKLIDSGFAKTFLVPYIKRYVLDTDTTKRVVSTKDAKEILEAS